MAEVFRMTIDNGACRNVPVYEFHKRGRNWMAKISLDPAAPGGLKREFFSTAHGDYFYLIPEGALKPGDPVEFGADYYTGGGRKCSKRWYGVVVSVSDGEVEILRAETARQACDLAGEYRNTAPGRVIVTRHPAAAEFIRSAAPEFADAPVLQVATEEDVRGKVVAGNLPLHLAALAEEIWAVEFTGEPPRGQEYSLEDMERAGAVLRRYRVQALTA
ncbi:MAG: CRISPR-associated protein Csx16 [Moorellaceae bacterium]